MTADLRELLELLRVLLSWSAGPEPRGIGPARVGPDCEGRREPPETQEGRGPSERSPGPTGLVGGSSSLFSPSGPTLLPPGPTLPCEEKGPAGIFSVCL